MPLRFELELGLPLRNVERPGVLTSCNPAVRMWCCDAWQVCVMRGCYGLRELRGLPGRVAPRRPSLRRHGDGLQPNFAS